MNPYNAVFDFCNFVRGKVASLDLLWIDADHFDRALDILYKRGVRYVSFFSSESLLHPPLTDMIEMSLQEIWVLRSLETAGCSPCSWTTSQRPILLPQRSSASIACHY